MGITSTILSIILLVSLAALGYVYFTSSSEISDLTGKVAGLESEKDNLTSENQKVSDELSQCQSGTESIKQTSEAFSLIVNSFEFPGSVSAASVNSGSAATAKQQINDISDSRDKSDISASWDTFTSTKQLGDVMFIMQRIADNIKRSLDNAAQQSQGLAPVNG